VKGSGRCVVVRGVCNEDGSEGGCWGRGKSIPVFAAGLAGGA
jgi:hypothetical protein